MHNVYYNIITVNYNKINIIINLKTLQNDYKARGVRDKTAS